MDDELQQLADRLRRRREELEQAISEKSDTDDVVKRLSELRERIEQRPASESQTPQPGTEEEVPPSGTGEDESR